MKPKQYWIEVEYIAREVARISAEVQGPIIDEHLEGYDLSEMSVDELTNTIAQFYTEDEHQQWDNLDERSKEVALKYQVSPHEMATDVWTALTMLQDAENTIIRH
jgi:hypothetical protein